MFSSDILFLSLCCKPIVGLVLFSALWSGCCLFDTFPIFTLNFMSVSVLFIFQYMRQALPACEGGEVH